MAVKQSNLQQEFSEVNAIIYEKETIQMKDFVIGAFVGSVIGAAAALLLAPKPGTEFRTDVAAQAVTLKDKSVELTGVAKEKTAQIAAQVKEQSTQVIDKVKSAKAPAVTDDGTVSSEGEEPLEEILASIEESIEPAEEEAMDAIVAAIEDGEEAFDISKEAKHSVVE